MNMKEIEPQKSENNLEFKLYGARWITISIFALLAAVNAIQWLEYSIITNIIMKYYGVSSVAVDGTSMIAMATYPVLLFPATYVIDKIGLRYAVLLGGLGTTVGAWIKIFSVQPHLFWVGYVGQTVVFTSQPFILGLPPKIAAVWFGPNEMSTACCIGIFGSQLGTALSFILPPLIVENHDNLDDIGRELLYLFYSIAIFSSVTLFLIFVLFKSEPPSPPSKAQADLKSNRTESFNKIFLKSYKSLSTNKSFLLHAISFGINLGVYVTVCTLLNQFVLEYFEDAETDAGLTGLFLVVVGMGGVVIFGIVLDKTRKYKETAIALYGTTILSIIAFLVALEMYSKILLYIAGCLLGFFQTGYYGVGFEFGVELSYAQPESTSSGILVAMVQAFGIIFTLLLGQLLPYFGTFWALVSIIAVLTLGGIITITIPNKLRRQEALSSRDELSIEN
ncbi:hypothetical protein Trydic_g20445 [Trypoxylus dichotomus]